MVEMSSLRASDGRLELATKSHWNDYWLPSPLLFELNGCLSDDTPLSSFLPLRNATVDKLFLPGKKEWNVNLVTSLFPFDISSFILSIPLSQFGFGDSFIWGFSKNGDFSASSSYSLLLALKHQCSSSSPGPSVHFFWPKISLGTSFGPVLFPTKFIFFLWQLCHECVPVGDLLVSRGWKGTSICLFVQTTS